jgi:PAS domain S-box-containing protein
MDKVNKQILILEDDRDHGDILKRSFESANSPDYIFSVNIVTSLEQAESFLRDRCPDLIITDLVLPDGEGTELLSRQGRKPDYPVMLMTAHGDEQQAVDAMKAGAMDYVVKSSVSLLNMPAFAERVLEQWKELLEHKKNQQELKKSEYEKSLVFATVSELIVYLDKEFNILLANKATADALEMDISDIEGRKCYSLWQKRDEPCQHCPVARSFETGLPEEDELSSQDGRCWFIRVNPVKDKNNEITGAVEIGEEITDKKRAREKLFAYQKKLQSLGSQLLLAEEKERRRIAVNIHDDIGQNLALSKLTLQSLEQSTENRRMTAALNEVCSVIDQIIRQTRTLTFDLSSCGGILDLGKNPGQVRYKMQFRD